MFLPWGWKAPSTAGRMPAATGFANCYLAVFPYSVRPLWRVALMKPQVEIYDTTLRDGAQGEGINFSAVDKLRIAEKLDSFGVHYIEGGWPGSNPKDMEFFKQAAKRKWKHAQIDAFSMTRRKGLA